MKIVLKRVVAYIIDILLVSIISTFITSNAYINKDYNKYIDTYEKYETFYTEYEKSVSDLEKEYEDNKMKEGQYNKKIEKLNNSYEEKNVDYNYKLIKFSVIPTIISILVILMYFVVIQYYLGGITLGKKVMKLKVVSNNKKELNILNYLLRSLILNSVLINIINLICALVLPKESYLIYNQIIYIISYVIDITIVVMILFNRNNRGLHDFVSNTKVVETNKKTSFD